jgi:hypothetical protein
MKRSSVAVKMSGWPKLEQQQSKERSTKLKDLPGLDGQLSGRICGELVARAIADEWSPLR